MKQLLLGTGQYHEHAQTTKTNMKGNTPQEDIAELREVWVIPLEELIQELEQKSTFHERGS